MLLQNERGIAHTKWLHRTSSIPSRFSVFTAFITTVLAAAPTATGVAAALAARTALVCSSMSLRRLTQRPLRALQTILCRLRSYLHTSTGTASHLFLADATAAPTAHSNITTSGQHPSSPSPTAEPFDSTVPAAEGLTAAPRPISAAALHLTVTPAAVLHSLRPLWSESAS